MLVLVVLASLFTEDPPPKAHHVTVDELRDSLKAGTMKIGQDEVLKLAGNPAEMKKPGPDGALALWTWNYDTHIVATFKDDKLSGITGCLSPHLLVDGLTVDNFKRLRVGMTKQEVIDVLGKKSSSVRVGESHYLSWGRTAQLTATFHAKGFLFGTGLSQTGYVAMPPGLDIPAPSLNKK